MLNVEFMDYLPEINQDEFIVPEVFNTKNKRDHSFTSGPSYTLEEITIPQPTYPTSCISYPGTFLQEDRLEAPTGSEFRASIPITFALPGRNPKREGLY